MSVTPGDGVSLNLLEESAARYSCPCPGQRLAHLPANYTASVTEGTSAGTSILFSTQCELLEGDRKVIQEKSSLNLTLQYQSGQHS